LSGAYKLKGAPAQGRGATHGMSRLERSRARRVASQYRAVRTREHEALSRANAMAFEWSHVLRDAIAMQWRRDIREKCVLPSILLDSSRGKPVAIIAGRR
jgi:hypothetical protein